MHNTATGPRVQLLDSWPIKTRQNFGPRIQYDQAWFDGRSWQFDCRAFGLDAEVMRQRLLNVAWRRHLRARTHVAGERLVFQVVEDFYR